MLIRTRYVRGARCCKGCERCGCHHQQHVCVCVSAWRHVTDLPALSVHHVSIRETSASTSGRALHDTPVRTGGSVTHMDELCMAEIEHCVGPVFVNGARMRASGETVHKAAFLSAITREIRSVPDSVSDEMNSDVSRVVRETSAEDGDDDFWDRLPRDKETPFQASVLTPWLDSENAMGTDKSNRGVPYHTPHGGDSKPLGSGKPDGSSKWAPLCIEIKSGSAGCAFTTDDWGVLQEAIMRVRMQLGCYAFLCISVTLAVAGGNAYIVVMQRQLGRVDALFINRVKRSSVLSIWRGVNMLSQKTPHWFLTLGGSMMLFALESVGLDPWAHVSKLLPTPRENVFKVVSLIDRQHSICAVKILLDPEDVEVEVAADLFPALKAKYPQPFYCFVAVRGVLLLLLMLSWCLYLCGSRSLFTAFCCFLIRIQNCV